MRETDTLELTLSGTVQGEESAFQPEEWSWLWTGAVTLNKYLDFQDGKHIFITSLLTLH